ncbi:MAG: hypothetical protein ACYS22_15010, partial [Planctomycetota bacterium]|jgi:hypothetical protein
LTVCGAFQAGCATVAPEERYEHGADATPTEAETASPAPVQTTADQGAGAVGLVVPVAEAPAAPALEAGEVDEPYFEAPGGLQVLGPRLVGVEAVVEAVLDASAHARILPPIYVFREEGQRLVALDRNELADLRAGYGDAKAIGSVPVGARSAPAVNEVSVRELTSLAAQVGARTIALVEVRGEGSARRFSLVVLEASSMALLARREDLEPSFALLGTLLRELVSQ